MTCRPCWDTHILTYQQTDRQTDTQAYIHKSIQTYSYTYTWLHMCDVSPLWGGGWGGTRGGWIIYIYIYWYIFVKQVSMTYPHNLFVSPILPYQTLIKSLEETDSPGTVATLRVVWWRVPRLSVFKPLSCLRVVFFFETYPTILKAPVSSEM